MAEIETRPQPPTDRVKIMPTSGVYPRRDAVGLLNALKFHQSVIDSLCVGVMVVDIDARIVNVNPAAFEILGKSATEVLNHPVLEIFPPEAKAKLGGALKQVRQLPGRTKMSLLADFNNRSIRASVSTISQPVGSSGWVIVLEDTTCV
ncbi:MAG: PAS domain S-box protein [Deltaproteobacteria bacterium]|jgi:PAS domain S-box-containing protein|nr:PAS domain S-box protein [Deltaproteobacteria bacterium]